MFAACQLRRALTRSAKTKRYVTSTRNPPWLPLNMIVAGLLLAGCGESIPVAGADDVTRSSTQRILVMGDSMFAWHRGAKSAISNELERQLNTRVIDRSVVGARYNYALPISGALGLNISKQYRFGKWDWVVLNGGGNDLWFGCGCVACEVTLDRMISPDGTAGKIPDLVHRIRQDGAQLVFLGYLHSPGTFSIIDHCKDEAIELENRLAALSSKTVGFFFLRLSNLVTNGDRSFHSLDMIHPSSKASKLIGKLVAALIRDETP